MSLWWIIPLTLLAGIGLGVLGFYLYFAYMWFKDGFLG